MSKNDDFSTPVLIFGDPFLSKNSIISLKKNTDAKWVIMSASSDTLDSIRMEAGTTGWEDSKKVIEINDLPNRKNARDFLINLVSTRNDLIKIVIWDSTECIKTNPKTKSFDKTWGEFVKKFRDIDGAKIVNNGNKEANRGDDRIDFIKKSFKRFKKEISTECANLLTDIVGLDRGMLLSDIEKMAITAPPQITREFILENAFPSSKQSLLYNLTDMLDSGNYEESVYLMERFIQSEHNPNQLAETFLRHVRWQLAASYFWYAGSPWSSVKDKLLNMGKFPAEIWHDSKYSTSQKKTLSEKYKDSNDMVKYLNEKEGILKRYFKKLPPNKTKPRAERLAHDFWADKPISFLKNKVVGNRPSDDPTVKRQVLKRAISIYLFVNEKLTEIRYGTNPMQDLQEIIKAITNTDLSRF